MRENLTKKEALAKRYPLAVWILIALLFVSLFVCVLTIGVLNSNGELTEIATAADAEGGLSPDSVATFNVDTASIPTASSLGYPGAQGTNTFTSGYLTTTNVDFSGQSVKSEGWVRTFNPAAPSVSTSASAGTMKLEIASDDNRYNQAAGVLNYNLATNAFMNKLCTSSLITGITASVTATYSYNNLHSTNSGYHGWQVGASAEGKCANDFGGDFAGITYVLVTDTFSTSSNWKTGNISTTVTIKSGTTLTPYIHFALFLITDNDDTGYVQLTNIRIRYTFTRAANGNYSDSASTYVADGAAPQVTSIDKTTTDIKVQPYRTAAGDDTNEYNWPMWYDATTPTGSQVNRLLSRASDVCDVGSKIKLYSYTNTAIYTWNNTKLYKRVSFSVQDYYDYDGTGTATACSYPYSGSGIGSIQVGDVTSSNGGAIFSYANDTGTIINTSTLSSYAGETLRPIYVAYEVTNNNVTETQYESVGYAYIKRSANNYTARQTATIIMYFSKNANITVTVTDFGEASMKQKIEVRGIDTTVANAPNVPAEVISGDKNISTSKDYLNMEWIYTNQPTFELKDNTDVDDVAAYDEGINPNAPYIYYYEMQKLDTRDPSSSFGTFTKKSLNQLKTMIPFNVGYIDSFAFDFEAGCTINGVYPDGKTTAPTTGQCKGNGYYHLRIYAVDLCGNYVNTTSVVEYYFKVDYQEAEYVITMNYDFEGSINTISLENNNNGTWATDQLEVILHQNVIGYSGNTIVFTDPDEKAHTIVIGSLSTTVALKNIGCDIYSIDGIGIASVPKKTLSFDGEQWYEIVENQIYFKAIVIGTNNSFYEYKFLFCPTIDGIETYTNFDYQTTFEIANGISYDDAEIVYTDPDWKNSVGELGVIIRIDRNKPMNPDFSDVDYTYFQDSATYMPADEDSLDIQLGLKTSQGYNNPRYWYTSGYTINSQMVFSDALADLFSKEVRVYIGYKNVSYVGSSFGNFIREEDLTTNISQTTRTKLSSYATEMNSLFGEGNWMVIDGGKFGDDPYAINNYNLFQRDGIGLRLIYIWAVDQAGNMSEISTKYILVDPTTYHVNARYYQEDIVRFGADVGTISITNSEERIVSSFKRSETILLISDLKYDDSVQYVPYKLNKYVGSEVVPTMLGINNGSGTSMVLVDDIIMTYSSGTYTYNITTDIDSVFNYYNTNTTENTNNDGIVFEIMFRKVLKVELNVPYGRYAGVDDSGKPLITLPYVISDTSDEARAALSFKWYESSDMLTPTSPTTRAHALSEYGTPVNADDNPYFVVISTDSDFYIIKEDVDSEFTINKANITITIKNNASFEYKKVSTTPWKELLTISGLCGVDIDSYASMDLSIFGTSGTDWEIGLKNTNGQDVVVDDDLQVGVYTPYVKIPFVLENYSIAFVTTQIQVTKYGISAIVYSNSKTYGNDDPIFKFGIEMIALDSIGITYEDVFVGSALDVTNDGTYYIFTPTTQWIKRLPGENAGTYTFTTSISDFAIADAGNYTVSIDISNEPIFTIEKRNITVIPDANQESLDTVGTIRYSYNSIDAKYFTAEYITGKLGIADTPSTTVDEVSYTKYTYAINLGTLAPVNANNIQLALSSSAIMYTIKVYNDSSTLIKVTQVAAFEFTYSEVGTPTFTWNSTDYTTNNLPEGYTISWTFDPNAITDATTVGNHVISVSNVKAMKSPTEEDTDYEVVVGEIVVTILPKQIVVTPDVTKASRIYGYLDTDATNGYKIDSTKSIAGIVTDGDFVRGVFNALTGELIAKGSRFDPVSNETGDTTYNGIPAYYGLTVGTDFVVNNPNYTVVFADSYTTTRLVIEQRKIVLDPNADFYGVNKSYDGTTAVIYKAGDISVNISDKLARVSDDVTVLFSAVYDSPAICGTGDHRTITFSELQLSGADSGNYVLYFGDASTLYIDQTVTISKLYPDSSSPYIQITKVTEIISISKSDFTISKQYDGTTTMRVSDVSMVTSHPLNAYISAVQQSAYPAAAVSNDYITNVKIIFNYEYTESNIVINDPSITPKSENGKLSLTIERMPVYITRRVISIDSIASATGVDRTYDTTNLVDVDVTLKDGVLVSGDYISDVGLKFTAHAAKLDKINPGVFDRSVVYQGAPSYFTFVKNVADAQNVNVYIDSATTAASSNYVCDITADEWAEFCTKNESMLRVTISRAELEPAITIAGRQYNGKEEVESSLINKSTTITSTIDSEFIVKSAYDRTYINNIYAELADISYEFANLKVILTKNGVKYPYVAFDETGLLVRHAVSFKNLIITYSGALTNPEVNEILSNYTLYGTFYNVSGEGTVAELTEKPKLALGTFISEEAYDVTGGLGYESTITMLINRKNIVVRPVSVSVENKVYDGTTAGVASINNPKSIGVEDEDADHIDISLTAVYSQRDVGNDIRVDINNVKLSNKIGSEIDYVANYEVTNTAVYTNRAITPSYATVNFDLAKKTYDGTNSVAMTSIKPSISVPYDRDKNNYSVNYSFGFLGGADVAVEGGDQSSDTATIYGVKLVSSRTEVNYNLYLKKEVDFDIFDDLGNFTAEYIEYVKSGLIGVLDTSILALDGTIVDAAQYERYVNLNDYAATKFYYNRTNENRVAYVTLPVITIKTFRYSDYTSGKVQIDDATKIIGEYVSNTIRYVAASADAVITTSGSGSYDEREYTEVPIVKQYDHFVGPADLTFKINTDVNNFQKQYDGTKKINGSIMIGRKSDGTIVEGLPYNVSTDTWGGYIINFDIPLNDEQKKTIVFQAEYGNASAGVQNITFKILNDEEFTDYIFEDSNYSSSNTSVTVVGEIKRATINAFLEDNSVPYGTMIKDRVDIIRYSTNASFSIAKPLPLTNRYLTDNVDLYEIDGVLGYFGDYTTFNDKVQYYVSEPLFVEATDAELSEDYHFYIKHDDEYQAVSTVDPGETYYICKHIEMISKSYADAAAFASDINAGVIPYVFEPIQGSISMPKVVTTVTNATAVGTNYASLEGGNATNFKFELNHTQPGQPGQSILTVTPLTVYVYVEDVYADEEGVAINYADKISYNPSAAIKDFELGYAQSPTTHLSGFVNGQTASELMRKGELGAPKTEVRLYDGTAPGTTALTMADLATVSEQLPVGQFYFIYIDLSTAWAKNYVFELKAGTDFDETKVAKLLVEYPDITNYSVVNTIKTYNGSAINVDVIGEGGTVSYEYYNNSEMTGTPVTSVTRAGEYYAKVKVSKTGFKDWYGYATLKIKKSAFKITIPAIDVDYDGATHAASVRVSTNAPSVSDIKITYQIGSQSVGTPKDVGVYTVIAKYTADENLEGFAGGPYKYNFTSSSANGALVIHGAVVNVRVSDEDKNTMIKAEGETAQLNYHLSVDEKYYDMLSNAGWDYENLDEIVEYGGIVLNYYSIDSYDTADYLEEITEMGVYNYVFEVTAGANIILSGDVSGSFVVGTNKLDNQNSKQRTIINSVGNTILNADTKLVYENVAYTTKISSSATTAQYNAIKANNTLYTQIESNIPSLATKFYEEATLKGVLKVQMRMGDLNGESSLIQPNGKVKVTVLVPTSYEIDEQTSIYKVTANGTLEKVDYTVNGKYVTYETDYVNTIVFVRVNTFWEWVLSNWWVMAAAGGVVLILLVVIIVPSAVVGTRKRKAKKLAAATAGAGAPDNEIKTHTEDIAEPPVHEDNHESFSPDAHMEEPPMEELPPMEEEPPIEAPPQVEEPPMEEPPMVEEPPVVEEPAPSPEAPVEEPAPETPVEEPAPVEEPTPEPEVPKKAPPPGAVGQKPNAAPKKAPPPGAVGQKPAAAPKKAPPPGAVGTKKAAAPKKAPPPGAIGKKD